MSGPRPADLPGREPDVEVDAALVRRLLTALPDELSLLRDLPVEYVAQGWDNSVWRVGTDLAARVPRRPLAAQLIRQEARWSNEATAPLLASGVAVPRTVHLSEPGAHHPHPWLLVTWLDGELVEGLDVAQRATLPRLLAQVLPRLHRPAPPDAPVNPFRGPDLRDMPPPPATAVAAASRHLGDDVVARLMVVLSEGMTATPWPGPRTWCHGDLHPRNLLHTPDGGLGVLDLGDVTAGDPAVDLGVLWTTLDQAQRAEAMDGLAPAYDADVWVRARGWAARFVLAVAGQAPEPFEATLRHAVTQLG